MRLARQRLMTAILLAIVPAAQASSPEAWRDLYARASAACVKASALNGATVRSETGDSAGAVLLIVDGRHPNGTRGTSYCLHDKVTAKTEIAPAQITSVAPVTKASRATGRTCWNVSFAAQLKSPRPLGAACTAKNDEGDDYTGVVRR